MAKLFGLFIAILSIHCSFGVLPRQFDTEHRVESLPIAPDPDVLQYLTQLYENAKKSGRKPVDGELNLLPDESKGFANVVRCFPESEIDSSSHTSNDGNKRTMRFDLHGFKPAEEIVEVRLVLKQSPNAPEYTASVHEIMDDNGLKELDSHVYHGEWLNLNVHKVSEESPMMVQDESNNVNMKSYILALKISDLNANWNRTLTLKSVKPMLIVYVYDKNMLKHGNGEKTSSASKASTEEETNITVKKRHADNTVKLTIPDSTSPTDPSSEDSSRKERRWEEMRKSSCRLYSHTTSHEDLGWPQRENITVLTPLSFNFNYCYGYCNRPFVGSNRERQKYTRRAQIISYLNQDLSEAGLAPCCVPIEFDAIGLQFQEDGITATGSFPIVSRCGCR